MFVLQRKDGSFVTPPGWAKSSSQYLQDARTFRTKEQAAEARFEDSECVVAVEELLQDPE